MHTYTELSERVGDFSGGNVEQLGGEMMAHFICRRKGERDIHNLNIKTKQKSQHHSIKLHPVNHTHTHK